MFREDLPEEGFEIQPLVRRVLDGAVVEVETVDVDEGLAHKEQRPAYAGLATRPEGTGGVSMWLIRRTA